MSGNLIVRITELKTLTKAPYSGWKSFG